MSMGKNQSKMVEQPLSQILCYVEETLDLSQWMSQLPAEILHVPIIYLAIPGSHNSLTYTITKFSKMAPDVSFLFNKPIPVCFRPLIHRWCKTQELSITSQLENGIRYIDVRVSSKTGSDNLFVVHGMYGGDIKTEIDLIDTFLESHPKEIVIIDFQHFYSMTNQHHNYLKEMIKNVFKNKICPPSNNISKINLDFMHSNNYQVIILYRSNMKDELFWSGNVWPTYWPNTMSTSTMIRVCKNMVEIRNTKIGLISQGVLTAKTSTTFLPTGSVKNSCAEKALPPLLHWLNRCLKENLSVNVIIADYVHNDDNLFTKAVISLNFRRDLPQLQIG